MLRASCFAIVPIKSNEQCFSLLQAQQPHAAQLDQRLRARRQVELGILPRSVAPTHASPTQRACWQFAHVNLELSFARVPNCVGDARFAVLLYAGDVEPVLARAGRDENDVGAFVEPLETNAASSLIDFFTHDRLGACPAPPAPFI